MLCSANDLITAYLAIELQSLAFYILAAFQKNSTYSVEAGLKYFILGAFSSGLFLFGSSQSPGQTQFTLDCQRETNIKHKIPITFNMA